MVHISRQYQESILGILVRIALYTSLNRQMVKVFYIDSLNDVSFEDSSKRHLKEHAISPLRVNTLVVNGID